MNHTKQMNQNERRSGLRIMAQMIGLVRPLLHIMMLAIILGTAGYLCAIFITILAGQALMQVIIPSTGTFMAVKMIFLIIVVIAVLRGVLHYAEQYCNHFIAFKLLAIIRHKVFASLRRLCPAKLEGRAKGNLISIITSDIELLEVFYAHTISPICIAVLTSLIMVMYIGHYNVWAGCLSFCGYVVVGAIIPLWNGRRGGKKGMKFRNDFGDLNSFVLDSLRGLDETIQYGQGDARKAQIDERSRELGDMQLDLSKNEGAQRSMTNQAIFVFSFGMLFLMIYMKQGGTSDARALLICTISMMGSFGPVVALSNLSNNLNQTLACGERVLAILEEEPVVQEIQEFSDCRYRGTKSFTGAELSHVTFAYDKEEILSDYSLAFEKGKITGIHGASGSGKSTVLKLLMRFWDANEGDVCVSGMNVKQIPTGRLRNTESYVTQTTHLFHDSIAKNIAVGKIDATREEIMEAAKKASIHDMIMSLPEGYDTQVGELGDTLSGGEKQRIGIARAFLHDAPFLLLDEPTSNLDSLNEGIILKSLQEACQKKTVVLVSHRKSTMNVADVVFEMKQGRIS